MAKAIDGAGRRVAKKGEPRLARYAEKNVTPVIDLYADWIEQEVGITLTAKDRKILYIGSALRGEFQKSDLNQDRIATRKEEIEAEEQAREERRQERAEKRAAKETAAKSKSTAPAKKTAAASKSAPAKKTGKTSGKTAPASRRRPAPTGKGSKGDF